VDLSSINLARLLVDAEQILVGVPPVSASYAYPGVPTTTSTTPPVLINLNTATGPELETLPGVGPVTAAAILQWRAEHGSYTSVDELLEIDGIGDATLAELAPLVTV
jgi:competence protein ComEA